MIQNLSVSNWIDLLSPITNNTVDLLLTDMPYNITACEWEVIIDLDTFFNHADRIIKDNGVICLTARQPFVTDLITAYRKYFRYELIWCKSNGTDFLNSKRKPLSAHENILLFYKKQPKYNPQFTSGSPYSITGSPIAREFIKDKSVGGYKSISDGKRYPLSFKKVNYDKNKLHPTQKPLELFEWLIRTYTDDLDLVVDPFVGSGTTAVACKKTNRQYICGDISEEYIEIALDRIKHGN